MEEARPRLQPARSYKEAVKRLFAFGFSDIEVSYRYLRLSKKAHIISEFLRYNKSCNVTFSGEQPNPQQYTRVWLLKEAPTNQAFKGLLQEDYL